MTIGNQQVNTTVRFGLCHSPATPKLREGGSLMTFRWLELSSACYALLTIRKLTPRQRVITVKHARNHNQTDCFERKTSSNNTKTICPRICPRFFRGRKSPGICGRSVALWGASCAFSVAHHCGGRRDRSASINRSSGTGGYNLSASKTKARRET
jgi:hypothetical protein